MLVNRPIRSNTDLARTNLNRTTKLHVINEMKSKDLTPTQIAKQHNLNPSTVRNWVSLDAHNKVMRDNVGKPGLLDELAKAESIEVLKKKRKAQNLPNREDYREILSKKAVETNTRAGKNDLEVNISDSSFKKLKT